MVTKQRLSALLLSVSVSACGFQTLEEANLGVDDVQERVREQIFTLPATQPPVASGGAQTNAGIFVAAERIEASPASALPASALRAGAVRIQSRDRLRLTDIADRLRHITGIPHVVTSGPNNEILLGEGTIEEPDPSDSTIRMQPNLVGSLADVLDEVAGHFSMEWTVENGRVLFLEYVTRDYPIAILPGTFASSAIVGSEGLSHASTADGNAWADILQTAESLAGDDAAVNISEASGLLTVTATPTAHRRVDVWLQSFNRRMSQQIALDVNILTVTLENSDGYGVDISELLVEAGDLSLNWTGNTTLASPVGALNVAIINDDFRLDSVISALSRQGRVAVENRTGATTANNRMVPIEVVDEVAYVAQREIVFNTDGNPTGESITPETITTGLSLQLLPRILDNSRIALQFSVQISELDDIREFGTGDQTVELPETTRTAFSQQAIVPNGETLVIAGFERNRHSTDRSGVGDSDFWLLGGGVDADIQRVATVITITPRQISTERQAVAWR